MPRVIVQTDDGREVAGFRVGRAGGIPTLALHDSIEAARREQAAVDERGLVAIRDLEPGDRVWVDHPTRPDWSSLAKLEARYSTYRVYFLDGPLRFQDYASDAKVRVRRDVCEPNG